MGDRKEEMSKFLRKLSVRLPLMFVLSTAAVLILVLSLVTYRFHARMIDEYARMAEGVTNLMSSAIDPERIEEYKERNFRIFAYRQIVERLQTIKENYPDVAFLYVYKIQKEGGVVIFDTDITNMQENKDEDYHVGSIYKLEEPFASMTDDIMAGKQLKAYAVHTEDGYLLSYIRPLFDKEGNYACSVCVDFSMDNLYSHDIHFIVILGLILLIVSFLILWIDVYVVKRQITDPIEHMTRITKLFHYETEDDRFNNIQLMEELNIHTGDEIEDLYTDFLAVIKESFYYMTNLTKAKDEIRAKEERISYLGNAAFKDSLTNVGNKAAYLEEMKGLAKTIGEGRAKFGIVMIDVNNLKYINDVFGHEKGDEYLKGSCMMICDLYKKSPVYRIGGDEFVVLLKGHDYDTRQVLFAKLMIAFNTTFKQLEKEPWERYSASMGMSEWNKNDLDPQDVFKRADEQMYKNKKEFKKKNGSYR